MVNVAHAASLILWSHTNLKDHSLRVHSHNIAVCRHSAFCSMLIDTHKTPHSVTVGHHLNIDFSILVLDSSSLWGEVKKKIN